MRNQSAPVEDPYNPYEVDIAAKQLTESVPEFLKRLPPLTTSHEDVGPWIWVLNPHVPRSLNEEDWAGVMSRGQPILEGLTATKKSIEEDMQGKAQSAITRQYNKERVKVEEELRELAKNKHCTSGKWLLFPLVENVNDVWAKIATATAAGELGPWAKCATQGSARNGAVGSGAVDAGYSEKHSRVICVYTYDFTDLEDVKRVLRNLVDLDLVREEELGLSYKSDVWTYLSIDSKNRWNIPASFYRSHVLMGEKS